MSPRLHDDVLAGFWSWYDGLSDAARAQAVGPLLNKLRAFLLRGFVRAAIAGGPSTIDMSDAAGWRRPAPGPAAQRRARR